MIRKQKLFLVILLLLMAILLGCGKKETAVSGETETPVIEKAEISEAELTAEPEQEKEVSTMQFPILLEDGKLEIESIFQYEGFNPDANYEMGTDIAAISVNNVSDMYLQNAEITLKTQNEEFVFAITELPPRSSSMVFSIENKSLEKDAQCINVECEALFRNDEIVVPEQISIEIDGVQVSITNVSEQDLGNVKVHCRCPFDEDYFGGIAYQYELQELSAGETGVVNAEEFLLGLVEVVRVEIE